MWMLAGLVIAFLLILWIIIDIGMPMSYLTIPEPLQITIAFLSSIYLKYFYSATNIWYINCN